ncbi:tensin-2 isoform X1 [Xenopus laevis]|uniref:Tensin-2 isoform X1 n=2 Tax=Xenopus laevis TaxID=8355 RepID=A0A8J0UJK9_XENLA|nr:tensin-2 isoform X1 [Xenopus laevis]
MKPRKSLQDMLRGLSRSFNCATPTGVERHVFQEKTLKKKRLCAACSEPVVSQGSVCRVCKITSHKKCEGKVIPGCSTPPSADMRRRTAPGPSIQHMGSTKSVNIKQRSSLPRNFSLDHVIQRSYDLDLTYITERIISVFFPTNLEEQRYRANLREVATMLKSKHEDKYLLFNLSRKRHDIAKLNPKIQDFFWPDGHAPPLDVICSICKSMEAWLAQDPQHVVVLHCKGNQGKTGVVIASYMHYSKVSASADQALSTLAMRKFCEDKVSVSLHPSQRRYINYFGGLLSGTIKISSDMLSLQCVMLPFIPALQTAGGFCPFVKIYQSMQLVYTSGIYSSHGGTTPQKRQLCISLEPALLLKGDIMVKCYHKRCKPHEREVLFRVQFHTCTIHKTHLCFSKDQLDCAFTDDRFPDDASVEFMFSAGQDKAKDREVFSKDPNVSVDYDITDPLVRFDSYENLNMIHEDSLEGDLSHTRGPLDGSLYARVKKKVTPVTSSNGSPEQHRRLLSVSSDSGHSSAPTERLEETPQKSLPTATERQDLERLLGGFGVSVKQEAEPHYSQVLKHEEVATQNLNQRQQMEERGLDQEDANQNIQTKINGEVRSPYSPVWPVTPDGGAAQCLPLASSCWEGQREAACETHWNGQREAAILEEEMGQYGELAMYPGRRHLISRQCSCRLGYSGPNIEGPPNRNYFRQEGIIDTRGGTGAGVILQNAHYPGMYGEQERRRLFRSLSEGPQHYPAHAQSPPKRGSLRDTRPYICQPSPHEPPFPPACPCAHCQNSACYPVTNMQPFHRGELPLHIPQPYGQSVQINHDFPHPFQFPQTKMLYGYPPAHGEEPLHFNHFTEGGYGHTYPHFLNPSYLPPHCPPNGYGPHTFPNSISPYSPPRGQSPPSGSVSPANVSDPRRMSGDTISASSVSELTSVEQQQQEEPSDRVMQLNAPTLQLHQHMETGPAVSSSAILHSNSSAQGSPQQSSSPMDAHIARSTAGSDINMHVHSLVQAEHFVHPHSPVHTSTPINTHCQSIQTNNLLNVQNPTLQSHSVTQKSPTSPTLNPLVHMQNPTLPGYNQGQTSPTSLRTAPPVHMHNPSLQSHSQGQTCPTMHISAPPVHMQTPALQSHSQGKLYSTSPTHAPSVHVQNPALQSHSQGQTCPTSTPHNPAVHTQNPAFQSQCLGQTCPASPAHSPSSQLGHTTQLPSPSVQLNGSSQHMSLAVQGHGKLHSPDKHGQVQDNVPTNGLTANSPLNTKSSPERPDIPNHTQNTCTQAHNPPLPSEPHVQTGNCVVKQISSTYPHSPNHRQSSEGQAPVPPAIAPTQTNVPQQKLVQSHSSVSTNSSSVKPYDTVYTQSQLVQTDTSVGTQIPPIQSHHPVPKPSQVHTQSPSVQLYRTIGGQCSSVQTQKTAPTHANINSAAVTDRPGLAASHVNTANEANTLLPSSFSQTHVTKVPVTLEAKRSHSTYGPIISSASGTIAFGSSYSPQSFSVPKITVPLQKRSVTISLPVSPVNPQGKEAPTSPPKSPMGSQSDLLPPSPTPSFPIRTAFYSSSPCPPNIQPPQLPEKCHSPAEGEKAQVKPNGLSECNKGHSSPVDTQQDAPVTGNFVQDFSKFWYKPTISREQAIAILRGAEPGSFLIRDSNSFRGAYGLALKVSSPPPNVAVQLYKGDSAEQLVRHFLIETGPKGVKIKGSPIEPHFGSLSALVSQHSVTPLSLPCRLHIPSCDLVEQSSEVMVPTNMSTAADLLRQGAACSVLFLGSVDTESLTGPQAISRASNAILTPPRSSATTVHFKVSDQGITLTDSQRKLFFRRHYPVSSVTYCSSDPQDRRWTNPDRTTSKVFGFVARKAGTAAENVCHLFAELDPEQPASAIVNFITKVMLGAHKR